MSVANDAAAWLTDAGNWAGTSGVPNRVWEHLKLSFVAVGAAALVGLPLGVWLGHLRRFGGVAMNVSNVGRALPSFALLVFGAQLWGIDQTWGMSRAALLAMFALALPPIVTTAYVGMASVDDSVRDAARGMGMTGWQSLWGAELPLAVPMVMAGLRIASLQVVATATLAAVVASGGLGRYIVDGFAVRDYGRVVAGALLVTLLALALEGGLALLQRAATPRGVRLARS